MSQSTMLFVWTFVAMLGWVFVASAVAVGVEHGLRRYHGEASTVLQTSPDDQESTGDETV